MSMESIEGYNESVNEEAVWCDFLIILPFFRPNSPTLFHQQIK